MASGVQISLAVLLFLLPVIQCLLRKSSECSESMGCISNPEATLMLTWQPETRHVYFTLRGYIGTGDLYVAMGLSHDQTMALSNQTGIYESGTIQCSFTRPTQGGGEVNGGQGRHSLEQDWHVMLVWGQLEPGTDRKQQHTYRSVSSDKVSLRAVGSFETEKFSDTLIHLHGCLMLIAWVTMTSIGVMIARHYKGLLPGVQLCGKDLWFQVHRTLMVLVVLLTVSGIVVIFVEVGGYRQIHSSTNIFALLHPILGLTVTGLALLNPIIALFRPTPTSPRRPIFNWVHRCIGTGSHVVGVITIFFGLQLKKVLAPLSMLFALGGFVVWHITMETIFFCIVYARNKNDKRRDSTRSHDVQDDKQASPENRPRPPKVSVFQEILLMMHSAVAIATTIFVLSVFLSGHKE